ncbi:MAG: Wzz/FepE/Etk N-terminal domain-containing protein, partial [Lapillicoccus sp.]
MELRDYLCVLRKRWLLILVVTLVTLGVAALATVLSPKVYSAQT